MEIPVRGSLQTHDRLHLVGPWIRYLPATRRNGTTCNLIFLLGAAHAAKGGLLLWAFRHSRPSLRTCMARLYIPVCQGGPLNLQAHIVV